MTGTRRLYEAIREGEVTKVRQLLAQGADPNKVLKEIGYTPLTLLAVDLHNIPIEKTLLIAEALLAYGGNPNTGDQYKQTPLHHAARRGKGGFAKFLLDKGVDINIQDEDGRTPLYMAAEKGHMNMMKILGDYNADPAMCSGWKGPLHVAVSQLFRGQLLGVPLILLGIPSILPCKYLLNIGANPCRIDENEQTPLQMITTRLAALPAEHVQYNEIITLLEKFENLHSLTTEKIAVSTDDNNQAVIQKVTPTALVAIQLPNDQDLEPENLERFAARFVKNLWVDKVTAAEKVERLKVNLDVLNKAGYYPALVQAIDNEFNPLSLTRIVIHKIIDNIPKDKIGLLPPLPPKLKQEIENKAKQVPFRSHKAKNIPSGPSR